LKTTSRLAPATSFATVTPTQTLAPFVLGPRAFPTGRAVADDGQKWTVQVGEYGVVPNNFGELNDFLWTVPDSFVGVLGDTGEIRDHLAEFLTF
jgi:hypothetical protein